MINMDYDENLSDNPFFLQLQQDHKILIETAPLEGWIICVPRRGCLHELNLKDPEFLLAHILVSHDELPETHFTNLIGKNIKVLNRQLFLSDRFEKNYEFKINILFEEIFYVQDFLKYKVWCIESPLIILNEDQNLFGAPNRNMTILYSINSYKEAIYLLTNEITGSQTFFKKLDHILKNFIKTNKVLNDLEKLKVELRTLITNCVEWVKRNQNIRMKINGDDHFLKNVEISIETYIINYLYSFIFNKISINNLDEIEAFNKQMKNISELSLENFLINSKLSYKISYIKLELSNICNLTNVLDKIACLKRTFSFKNNENLTIDDFLPILIFCIVKSAIPHWITNIVFLKEFFFNSFHYNSDNFLITTLEAAIAYIKKNEIKNKIFDENIRKNDTFRAILEERESEIIKIFGTTNGNGDDGESNDDRNKNNLILCHPLCDCSECLAKVRQTRHSIDTPDPNGFTPIHVAAMYGLSKMLNLLIALIASVNVADDRSWTPLHYAASRGHQNILLLLLHAGADINAENNDKNGPLHVAAINGHTGCIKAILYFADYMKIRINVNARNHIGNTALHYASRWCFVEIVESLLEYGAVSDMKNNFGQTPFHLAHNHKIEEILQNNFILVDDLRGAGCSLGMPPMASNANPIDKVINAISHCDTNLALYYLGIERNGNPTSYCHPLCECSKHSDTKNRTISTTSSSSSMKSVDLNQTNSLGLTPLHAACYYGNYDIIEILITHNADVTIKSKTGQTALHLACQNEKVKSVQILLELKHEDVINLLDNYGNTALHLATKSRNFRMVETILKYNPDLEIRNFKGERVIDIAENGIMLNILEILKK